jgi:hypothetical protein
LLINLAISENKPDLISTVQNNEIKNNAPFIL